MVQLPDAVESQEDVTEPVMVPRFQLGRYELLWELGVGGMATVYLARLLGEDGFQRLVAVKQVHHHLADDPEFRTMLFDEARLAASLHHPNLVQVTDLGVEEGQPFLVMEFVNGETLTTLMRACHQRRVPVPCPVAAYIAEQVCQGLQHAHDLYTVAGEPQNLVHRDITPHNILISYDGSVRVTDFGIAKAVHRATLTERGNVKGKIGYLAPEQIQDLPLDRRSDIFSLGVVLYEATLDCRLFQAESDVQTLQRILHGRIPRPSRLDPEYPLPLEGIVLKALAQQREDRYADASEMERDLSNYLSVVGRPMGRLELSNLMEQLFAERKHERAILLSQLPPLDEGQEPAPPPNQPPATTDPPEPKLALVRPLLQSPWLRQRWRLCLAASLLVLALIGSLAAASLIWPSRRLAAPPSIPKTSRPVQPDRAALPFSLEPVERAPDQEGQTDGPGSPPPERKETAPADSAIPEPWVME